MIKFLNKANNFMQSKTMSAIDWTLSAAILTYGLYLIYSTGFNTVSILTTAAGCIGLVLAKIKPAKIIKEKLDDVILKKGIK